MVDFSLTTADRHLMDLLHREHEAARTVAREIDRQPESIPLNNAVHPAMVGIPDAYDALANEARPISGKHLTEALMATVSSHEFTFRGVPKAPKQIGSWLVQVRGTPEQKAAYGQLELAIAMTEPGAGADPSAMRCSAVYDPATDEYILNGEKTFISSIDQLDGAVVLVKGEPDQSGKRPFHNFVVRKDAPGFTTVRPMRKLGIRYHNLGGFVMEDLRVPAVAKLDSDLKAILTKLNHNRPWVASEGLGTCRSALDFTIAKLAEHNIQLNYSQGSSSRSFVQDKLLRMEALWEATWGIIMRCKWLEEQLGEESQDFRVEAAMAKAIGGKATREITQGCIEILGHEALSEDYLLEKWFRDARIIDIYEGPGEVHRLTVIRSLLGYGKGELD